MGELKNDYVEENTEHLGMEGGYYEALAHSVFSVRSFSLTNIHLTSLGPNAPLHLQDGKGTSTWASLAFKHGRYQNSVPICQLHPLSSSPQRSPFIGTAWGYGSGSGEGRTKVNKS